MQGTLKKLQEIVEEAERRAQSVQLKEALQQAEEEWQQAQKSYPAWHPSSWQPLLTLPIGEH